VILSAKQSRMDYLDDFYIFFTNHYFSPSCLHPNSQETKKLEYLFNRIKFNLGDDHRLNFDLNINSFDDINGLITYINMYFLKNGRHVMRMQCISYLRLLKIDFNIINYTSANADPDMSYKHLDIKSDYTWRIFRELVNFHSLIA
jgi:hypothetical protein